MTAPFTPHAREKLLDLPALLARFGRPREGTLVFTNGVFDVLHRGHVEYLEAARALGDHLVVGLNADASVRRLKGPTRPVNPQEDRAVVLGGLAAVDAVVLFEDDTPLRLVEALLPDVIVKGGDYQPETVVGAREVVAAGGRVVIAPLLEGRSTTRIVQRIQGTEGS
jgi:D-beta-D-heptose 7-phosphate kinase/D-beta-D-heptose 1-phosphate adenosyltransferase